jgi:hypothetical protein
MAQLNGEASPLVQKAHVGAHFEAGPSFSEDDFKERFEKVRR